MLGGEKEGREDCWNERRKKTSRRDVGTKEGKTDLVRTRHLENTGSFRFSFKRIRNESVLGSAAIAMGREGRKGAEERMPEGGGGNEGGKGV
jgi:hypothetical protein